MQVDTSVAEADIGKLQAGHGRDVHRRRVSRRARSRARSARSATRPQTLQNVVTYDAVIDVGNPELKLKPGMTANVTFIYDRRDDVLRVPNAALRFQPPAELARAACGGEQAARRGGGRGRRQRRGGGAAAAAGSRAAAARRRRDARPAHGLGAARRRRRRRCAMRVGVTDGTITEVDRRRAERGRPRRHRRRRAPAATGKRRARAAAARSGGCSDGMRRRHPQRSLDARAASPRSTSWATSRCTRCAA